MTTEGSVPEEGWRRHRLRQLAAFVTLPGLILGTASFAAAISAGWFTPDPPPPVCQPKVVPAPSPKSFTVNVLNASFEDGWAGRVATELRRRDFTIGDITNAPETLYVPESAVVYYGPAMLDQALLVQQQIKGSTLFQDGRRSKAIDLVVGSGFKRLEPIPPEPPPQPSQITVNVYNTTYKTGLAKVVAAGIKGRGFKIKDVDNDPMGAFFPESAMIRYGWRGKAAAKVLAKHVAGAKLVSDPRPTATIDFVIGSGWKGLIPVAAVPVDPPPPPKPKPTVARPCR